MFKIRRLFNDRIVLICDTAERAHEAIKSFKAKGQLVYLDDACVS